MHSREQVAREAARMSDTMEAFLCSCRTGWVAIRLSDGGSDGDIYADRDQAKSAQQAPCLLL